MNIRRYSPELVTKQWKIEGIERVSHKCIYDFIWTCNHSQKRINKRFKEAYKFLKHGKSMRTFIRFMTTDLTLQGATCTEPVVERCLM